ncbi:cathepsin S-like [Spea bombifrons]|uniref:cathepsin S-like n=1 Tax=Spea bombifrons TaxID=233779 RepID=UPI00234A3F45|nr:cathepsin S-like [Spea bombifrons]
MVSYGICLAPLFAMLVSAHGIPDPSLDYHWQLWVKTHRKDYDNEDTHLARRMIWEKNLKFIMIHNLEYSMGLHSYEVGMNHLGDMTDKEVATTMTGFNASEMSISNTTELAQDLANKRVPESMDWRNQNCVTNVKDQGSCACSWAFSGVGALECQMKQRKSKLASLSAQNLLDCSHDYGNNGCKGGFLVATYRYMKENGIELDSTYPFEGKDGICRYNPTSKAIGITSFKQLPYANEEALKVVVGTEGPVSVAIDASRRSFYMYKAGVYYDPQCSNTETNHAMLVIGYGADNGVEYWLVKNSWGTNFGEGGYIKIARNHYNHCGIANYGSIPTI